MSSRDTILARIRANRPVGRHDLLRWSRFIGQFGGLAKLGFGCRHAASFIVSVALYASSGVRPASVEWGRRAL
jgi:hypothetical protein